VKEGTFRRGAPCGNPSARTQLFAADRRTSHGSKKEETLRRPTEAPEETERSNCCPTGWWRTWSSRHPQRQICAPVLMPALRAAVTQKIAVTWWDTSRCPKPGEAY